MTSHSSHEHGSRRVDIENFWEGSVQDQGDALWQGLGKFHFQSKVSFYLDIKGVVRIDLHDIQAVTFSIVASVYVNVVPKRDQRSVPVY